MHSHPHGHVPTSPSKPVNCGKVLVQSLQLRVQKKPRVLVENLWIRLYQHRINILHGSVVHVQQRCFSPVAIAILFSIRFRTSTSSSLLLSFSPSLVPFLLLIMLTMSTSNGHIDMPLTCCLTRRWFCHSRLHWRDKPDSFHASSRSFPVSWSRH